MNKVTYTFISVFILFSLVVKGGGGEMPKGKESISAQLRELSKNLPVSFRKNEGQWPEQILYRGSFSGGNVCFLKNGLSYTFSRETGELESEAYATGGEREEKREVLVWNLLFENANLSSTVAAHGETRGKFNYFIGNNPSKFVSGAKDSKEIEYGNIYNKIDLKYYATEYRELKYDFVIHPGGHINDILMRTRGAGKLMIDRVGQLMITTPWGSLQEKKPYSYQIINGQKTEVDIRYEIHSDSTFGFKLFGKYDPSEELVIDPVVLKWNTYVGDQVNPLTTGYGLDLYVDELGYSYVAGFFADDFETTPGVYDNSFNGKAAVGNTDVIVFKLSPDGKTLVFGTYLGGRGLDVGWGIAVDQQYNVYVTGKTSHHEGNPGVNNFPTTPGVHSTNFKGGGFPPTGPNPDVFSVSGHWKEGGGDVIVFKLNPTGSQLLYSTFVGGTKSEEPSRGLAVNAAGEVFVAGATNSTDFPVTPGAYKTVYNGGLSDGFVFKLTTTGTIAYATYFGGSKQEYDFPNSASGSTYDRYLTGGFRVNKNDEVFVAGWTDSPDFPTTPGVLQTTLTPPTAPGFPAPTLKFFDGFVLRLNASGTGLVYSTYIGGGYYDELLDIQVDDADNAYVCGTTNSPEFPTTPGVYNRTINQNIGKEPYDAVVFKLAPDGKKLIYSTFLGGKNNFDEAVSLDINSKGEVFVTGVTDLQGDRNYLNSSFPVTSCAPWKKGLSAGDGAMDMFISKINATGTRLLYSTFYGGDLYDYQPKIVVSERIPCMEEVTLSYDSHSHNLSFPAPVYQNSCSQISANVSGLLDCPLVARFEPDINADFSYTVNGCDQPVVFKDLTPSNSCIWQDGSWNPTSWTWNFGDGASSTQQDPSHKYAAAGSYKVTLIVGCPADTVVKYVTITSDLGAVDLGNDTTICSGVSVVIDSKIPSANYSWNTGETTQSIIVNTSGVYYVSVDNGTGCPAVDSIRITVVPPPVVDLSYIPVCEGEKKAITLDAGNPGAIYTWSTGETSQTIVVPSAGFYSVTVSIGACTATDTITISFKPYPVVTLRDTTLCGSSAVLDAQNPGATYTWSTGATTQSIAITANGQYSVTVNLAGCESSASANIQFQAADVQVTDTVFCEGMNILLVPSIPGTAYLWSDGSTGNQLTVSQSGDYWVLIANNNGICGKIDTVHVRTIPAPVVVLTGDTICEGGAVVLDAGNPGASYLWNTGATTSSISVSQSGIVNVEVMKNGCKTNASVAVQVIPSPSLILTDDTVLCKITDIKLTASGNATSYLWSTGETSSFISVNKSGTYWVMASNEQCSVIDTVHVTFFDAHSKAIELSLCDQPEIKLQTQQKGTAYLWNTGATTPDISVVNSGIYWVETTNGLCKARDTVIITGEYGTPTLFIPNSFTPTGDSKNERFTAYGTEIVDFQMEIFNRWGELYYETRDMAYGWDGKHKGTIVQEDVYVYIIKYHTTCNNQKKSVTKLGHVSVIR